MMHSHSHHPRKLSPDYQYFCLNWCMSDERISANGWLWGRSIRRTASVTIGLGKGSNSADAEICPRRRCFASLCKSVYLCMSMYETLHPPHTHTLPPPLGWWLRVKTKGKINLPLGQETDNFSQELTLHRVKKITYYCHSVLHIYGVLSLAWQPSTRENSTIYLYCKVCSYMVILIHILAFL